MDISKSDIVISAAGRDEGRLFYVLKVEGNYAFLTDGKMRKVETPKRKKLKHIRFVARSDTKVACKIRQDEPLLNSELRRDLAILGQEIVRTKEAE